MQKPDILVPFGADLSVSKPIMNAAETSRYLGFASTNALLRARKRGLLPIEMFQIPGRRGWFAATRAVMGWVEASTRRHLNFQLPTLEEDSAMKS
jgi:hypothetical protein